MDLYRDYFKAKVYPIRVPGPFGDCVVPSLGSLRSFFGNPVTGNNSGFEGLGFRVYTFFFLTPLFHQPTRSQVYRF